MKNFKYLISALASLIMLAMPLLAGAAASDDCDCAHFPWTPDPPCMKDCGNSLAAAATVYELMAILGVDQSVARKINRRRGLSEDMLIIEEYQQVTAALDRADPFLLRYLLLPTDKREEFIESLSEESRRTTEEMVHLASRLDQFTKLIESADPLLRRYKDIRLDLKSDGSGLTLIGTAASVDQKAQIESSLKKMVVEADLDDLEGIDIANNIEIFSGESYRSPDGLSRALAIEGFENRSAWEGEFDVDHTWEATFSDSLRQIEGITVVEKIDTGTGNDPSFFGRVLIRGAILDVNYGAGGMGKGMGKVRLGGKKKKSAEIRVSIRMIDTVSGQVVASTSIIGKNEKRGPTFSRAARKEEYRLREAIADASSQAADWLIEQLEGRPQYGNVVMVRNGEVYINRGRRDGIVLGQKFSVGNVESSRDPETGEALSAGFTKVAIIKVVRLEGDISICEVVAGEWAAIQKGQTAKFLEP